MPVKTVLAHMNYMSVSFSRFIYQGFSIRSGQEDPKNFINIFSTYVIACEHRLYTQAKFIFRLDSGKEFFHGRPDLLAITRKQTIKTFRPYIQLSSIHILLIRADRDPRS